MPRAPKAGFPAVFTHPSAGELTRDPRRIAVRWHLGADDAARELLLERHGLESIRADEQRPAVTVNRTEGLWWARSVKDDALSDDALAALAGDPLVDWVSPGYGTEDALVAINPTRFYAPEQVSPPAGTTPDRERTSQLPGLVALVVERPGASALTLAAEVEGARVESVPYLSPLCCTGCSPAGDAPFEPDDPLFTTQWGLERVGAQRAWAITRGDPSVTIAVLDQGVELGHPDLDLHPRSWNASTDTPDGSPTGDHGTACAGIAAARLDNGQGVAGLGGGARVMAIATATWADADIAEGLYFAADNGARVVSMSFGVYPSWNMWDFDLIRDALQYAYDKGLVLVAASGNEDGPECRFPGSDARVITVGGLNRADERKRVGDSSSEPFWGACFGPDVDVVAPCLEMATTDRLGGAGYVSGDYFDRFNGTSSATPLVAGLAALILSRCPDATNVDVRRAIETTCEKVSPGGIYAYAAVAGRPNGTWNEEVGHGLVDAEAALRAACAREREACDECRAPAPLPWLDPHRCMLFYEARTFDLSRQENRKLQLQFTYEHCLRLIGRVQGGLLYTLTLLPGEEVRLYEYDRYRRVRSEEQRMSVHTSFRQTLSALSQSRLSTSASAYTETLARVRTQADASVSAGGGLAGFFGLPSGSSSFGVATDTSVISGSSTHVVSDQFAQQAVTAAQSTDAERSVVVSRFEDAEHASTTSRTLRNENPCYAVTYFVRRVNEVYETSSRLLSIEWRLGDGPLHALDDLGDAPAEIQRFLKEFAVRLPRPGDIVRNPREITLPTDGTLYEAELAHCSACDPMREARLELALEHERQLVRRAALEADLLALEVQRRGGGGVPLELEPWPLGATEPEA
jgi:hypothetical protein